MALARESWLGVVTALAWNTAHALRHMHHEMTVASEIMLRPAGRDAVGGRSRRALERRPRPGSRHPIAHSAAMPRGGRLRGTTALRARRSRHGQRSLRRRCK